MKLARHLIVLVLFATASAQAAWPCPERLALFAQEKMQEKWKGSGLSFDVFEQWLESLPKDDELSGIVAFSALTELLGAQNPPLVMVPAGDDQIVRGTTVRRDRMGWIELHEPQPDFSFSLLYYHWEALAHGHPAWHFRPVLSWLKKNSQVDFSEAEIAHAINVGLSEKSPHDRIEPNFVRGSSPGRKRGELIFGIGVELTVFNGRIAIINTVSGTPAASAGLFPGDTLFMVAGKSVEGLDLDEVTKRMDDQAHREGRVTFQVLRDEKPLSFSLEPQQFQYPANVDSRMVEVRGVKMGLVRLKSFGDPSAERDMASALDDLRKAEVAGLVLDLRGNPGGQLDVAITIAGYFLGKGKVLVTEKMIKGAPREIEHKTRSAARIDVPLLILIDSGSASAAELLAGTLRHHKRAYLVGMPSFGKGSIQQPNPKTPESAVFAQLPVSFYETCSVYYFPSGWSPQHVGLTPDFRIPQPHLPSSIPPRNREASLRTSLYVGEPNPSTEWDPVLHQLRAIAPTLGLRPPDLDFQRTSALEILAEYVRLVGQGP